MVNKKAITDKLNTIKEKLKKINIINLLFIIFLVIGISDCIFYVYTLFLYDFKCIGEFGAWVCGYFYIDDLLYLLQAIFAFIICFLLSKIKKRRLKVSYRLSNFIEHNKIIFDSLRDLIDKLNVIYNDMKNSRINLDLSDILDKL